MSGQNGDQFNDGAVDLSIKVPREFLKCTVEKIPRSSTMAAATKLPMGGIIRPLSPHAPPVAVINPSASGIVRCKRCRTYMNPYVSWTENGRSWRCNICGQRNDVPSAYFCHLDEQGKRRDREQRPELCDSVMEYIAPAEYMVRPPQPPCYYFVIDVSATAGRTSVLKSIANSIRNCLDDLPGNPRTMVGFLTFDTAVHFYSLKSNLTSPQMLVVSDLAELFIPAPDDLLVNLSESKVVVEAFLDGLETMFPPEKNGVPAPEMSCLGPALKAAFTVVKNVGGKVR